MKRVTDIDIKVGQKIRLRRIHLGLSQHDLAKLLKITFQQIQKYEKGINRVSSGRLYHFARLLKVPIKYFFEDYESPVAAGEEDVDFNELNKDILLISRLLTKIKDKEKKRNFINIIKNLIKFLK